MIFVLSGRGSGPKRAGEIRRIYEERASPISSAAKPLARALADRNEVLLPDRQSAELGAAARRDNPAAVTQLPLEFVDDTLAFNSEWIVTARGGLLTDDDRLVPPQESEAMFARAGEPKKLVILKGFGHYEVYGGEAFRQVMDETVAWYKTHLPAR